MIQDPGVLMDKYDMLSSLFCFICYLYCLYQYRLSQHAKQVWDRIYTTVSSEDIENYYKQYIKNMLKGF